VGHPGQGKTYLALEAAARIATRPANGCPQRFGGLAVQHGSVVYFASEDVDGLQNRAAAWARIHGDLSDLHIFGRVPPLSRLDRAIVFVLEAIESALKSDAAPLRLLIVDVLRAAIEGEENSSDVVGPAMVAASVIARMTGATVLLVHHAALNDKERGRGSSAFTASQDLIAAVSQDDAGIALKVTKNRSGPAGAILRWHLREAVLRDGPSTSDLARTPTQTGAQVAGRVIREIARGDVPVTRRQLSAAMVDACPELLGPTVNKKTVESRVSRAIKAAVDAGWIEPHRGAFRPGAKAAPTQSTDFDDDLESVQVE